ncbi:N-acetyl-gamma-glutamyl-phosphate reductase [Methyloceanibacter methanicus]|uniref:N-acetyl-gamma-glutamyl-phosphate reductase n=1 Tax=Methyloceanibacter methanicus TaxID=1774968 RepID=A0A1E3W4X3_9HYPH|nr:N-acetyl-gamma-glutamyl-phosphate reductase [Methyloceanibacter methanicus]ODS00859.1 N-acetyl-gamma-glutamyl-phosphate reductase [Methyloceanibacter methanicus]
MTSTQTFRAAVLGASGYTGADLIRLAARHANIEIVALIAKAHAGQPLAKVFPHLASLDLPSLVTSDEVDWDGVDVAFCGLPHGTAHGEIAKLPERVKVIDMSADFRLRDLDTYAQWYGGEHGAPHLLPDTVYGLTEHYREAIADARLVACPGCYPTAVLLALLPLAKGALIATDGIIVDAKSGVSGAGRSLKQNILFSEAGEGLSPYGVGTHRHVPEIEQELGQAAGRAVTVNFTPHLVPMTRGELCTCYVPLAGGTSADDLRQGLREAYASSPFVRVVDEGIIPATQHVRGSNYCHIGVFADRIPGRAIVISTIDNLVKGSAGQALQNFNVMHGLDETTALEQLPLFP